MLATAAVEGRLDSKANDSQFQGKYREIIQGMNKMLEGFSKPINGIGEVLKRLARKDFSRAVDTEYPGAYGELRNNVNLVVTSIRGAIEQIKESGGQFSEGSRVIAESSQTLAAGCARAKLGRPTGHGVDRGTEPQRPERQGQRARSGQSGEGDQQAGGARRSRRTEVDRSHGPDPQQFDTDCRDHSGDRGDRQPNQPVGPQCGDRSRASR